LASIRHIVKRQGSTELFDERKTYASVYSACLAVSMPQASSELIAEHVTAQVKEWLEDKKEVTAGDIHRTIIKRLHVYNPDAAYLHENHQVIN